MRVQIGYEKSLNCIREGFYMYVWIMDYVLQFFAFTQSSWWSVQTCYSSFENGLNSFYAMTFVTNQVSVCYNLPGDPASALNSAGLVLSSIASSTEGNDADDPRTLGSGISAAHSKPSAATKLLSVLDYHHYMTHLLATEETTPLSSPGASSLETSPTIKGSVSQA